MSASGVYVPLSLPRRLVNDMLHFARGVPSVPVMRSIDVATVRRLRELTAVRPGWCALFLRAYGLVTVRFPELRRAYLSWPYARIYEHPFSIASVAFERVFRGEPGVFFAHIRGPENQPLEALQKYLRHFKETPVEDVPIYRRALRVSRFPGPMRRLMWAYALNLSGPGRARRLGTFGLSTYSSLGAQSMHPLSPLTTTLNYGPVGDDGKVNVCLVYDHRVMDGATVARALAALEEVFNEGLPRELRELAETSVPFPTRSPCDNLCEESLAG
jgi:hypothetical protein